MEDSISRHAPQKAAAKPKDVIQSTPCPPHRSDGRGVAGIYGPVVPCETIHASGNAFKEKSTGASTTDPRQG